LPSASIFGTRLAPSGGDGKSGAFGHFRSCAGARSPSSGAREAGGATLFAVHSSSATNSARSGGAMARALMGATQFVAVFEPAIPAR